MRGLFALSYITTHIIYIYDFSKATAFFLSCSPEEDNGKNSRYLLVLCYKLLRFQEVLLYNNTRYIICLLLIQRRGTKQTKLSADDVCLRAFAAKKLNKIFCG